MLPLALFFSQPSMNPPETPPSRALGLLPSYSYTPVRVFHCTRRGSEALTPRWVEWTNQDQRDSRITIGERCCAAVPHTLLGRAGRGGGGDDKVIECLALQQSLVAIFIWFLFFHTYLV